MNKLHFMGGTVHTSAWKMPVAVKSFLLNFGISFLAFLPFLIRDGGVLSLSNDFAAQSIPFYMFMDKAVHSGQTMWNWGIDLGGNVGECFAFYNIGSPFTWITFLVPYRLIPYLIPWLMMLKFAVSGSTSALYIQRHVKSKQAILVGELLYSFSGAVLCNLVFHFHDSFAFFPLMLLGMEVLVEEKKRGRLALACLLCALTNYIIFITSAIFVVLVYVLEYFIPALKEKRYREARKTALSCLTEGILGVLSGAILLIPAVINVLGNSRAEDKITGSSWFTVTTEEILRLFKALLFPTEPMNDSFTLAEQDWSSTGAYLPLFGIVLITLYLLLRKKDWLSQALLLCIVIDLIPLFNRVFTLFGAGLYHRWFYAACLLMALASAMVVEKPPEESYLKKAIGITLGGMLFYLLMITVVVWDSKNTDLIYRPKMFTVNLLVAVISVGVTYILLKKRWLCRIRTIALLSASCVFLTAFTVFAYQHSHRIQTSIDFRENGTYSKNAIAYLTEITKELEPDILPYRYDLDEGVGYSYYNLATTEMLPSVNSFSSTIDNSVTEFYDQLAVGRDTMTKDGPVGTNQLLGARYVVTMEEKTDEMPLQTIMTSNGLTAYVYEDQLALPIGFTYTSYITRSEFETLDKDIRALTMLKTLVVRDEDEDTVSQFLVHQPLEDCAALSEESLSVLVEAHQNEVAQNFEASGNRFRMSITSDGSKYAFFSVPYSKYWHVTVNDVPETVLNINGLMAVKIGEGTNEISFDYVYTPFAAGVALTALSLVALAGYVWLSDKRRNKSVMA